jgi:large subunit ribosomal protein L21
MFAVVNIAGQQFKVSEKTQYYVPKLNEEPEKDVTFKDVLLISDENGTKVGNPFLNGVEVKAKVLGHLKDDKVIVFKKKRRTGYDKKNGHRQQLTKIEITNIG